MQFKAGDKVRLTNACGCNAANRLLNKDPKHIFIVSGCTSSYVVLKFGDDHDTCEFDIRHVVKVNEPSRSLPAWF